MSRFLGLFHTIFFAYFSSFLFCNPIRANEVTYKLTNGDIVSGFLIKEKSSEETIVINSPIFGIISIDISNIISDDLGTNYLNESPDNFLQIEDQTNKRWESNISINSDSTKNDGDIYERLF